MIDNKIRDIINNNKINTLRKYQLVTLEILLEVDRICRENNINYWLDAGTLLGAVRHRGFIPWDDDIDICMPRNDYDKFIKIIQTDLNKVFCYEYKNSKYWIQSENYLRQSWLKIYYLKHFKSIDNITNKELKGTFIDIFPVDEVSRKMVDNKINGIISKILCVGRKNNTSIKYMVRNLLQNLKLEKIWIMKSKKLIREGKSKYIVYGIETQFMNNKYLQKIEDIYPLKELEFEKNKFYVPNNYHQYLTNIYGDYMKEVQYPAHNNSLIITN